jgi:hypothetical protein
MSGHGNNVPPPPAVADIPTLADLLLDPLHANHNNAQNHVQAQDYALRTLIAFMEAALVVPIPPPPTLLPVAPAAVEAAVTSITTDVTAVAAASFDAMYAYETHFPETAETLQRVDARTLSSIAPPHYAEQFSASQPPSWAGPPSPSPSRK